MRFGIMDLICPICGGRFKVNTVPPAPGGRWHSKEFGYLCSKTCYEESELKYARMILGKDD